MRSKKGEGWKDIQYAVIATIIIVLLAAFTYNYFSKVKEKLAIQDCQNSISAHTLLASITEFQVITDIKCPTRQIVVKTTNEEKAKNLIAEDMHRCWYEWGRGNLTLFEGDGVFCHVCAIYTFDNASKRISGFAKYVATENIKPRFPTDPVSVTYLEYFQGVKNVESRPELLSRYTDTVSSDDYIDTSKTYASIFVYASGKSAIDKALENGGKITAGTVGVGAMMMGVAATGAGISAGVSMIGTAAAAELAATATTIAATTGSVAAATTAASAATVAATTAAAVNWWNPVGWIIGGVILGVIAYAAIDAATSHENVEWISVIVMRQYTPAELISIGCEKAPVNQQSHTTR